MHEDIEKAIQLINRRIGELEKAKHTLIEAFGEKSQIATPSGVGKITKKEIIRKLLQEEGPLTSSEIKRRTNIARGTVSTVLNDKTTFKNRKQKWYVIEQKEEGEQKEKSLNPSSS